MKEREVKISNVKYHDILPENIQGFTQSIAMEQNDHRLYYNNDSNMLKFYLHSKPKF